jgi:hypothetical protein
MTTPTIPADCAGCGAQLQPHNLTRLCAECKLTARNRRLSGQPPDTTDPVSYKQALTTLTTLLGARIITTGTAL